MKYLVKFLKTLLYPVFFLIGEILVEYFYILKYNRHQLILLQHKYPDLSSDQIVQKLNKMVTTEAYRLKLNNFLNSKTIIIILITLIIFVPLFYNLYKKYRTCSQKLKRLDIVFIILLGMSVSLFFNNVFNIVNNIFPFTDNFMINHTSLSIQIISSGIVGPILEELVFRGIVYNKLKEFNSYKKAIVLSSVIFALFHFTNILNMVYAFVISFLLIYVYEKYGKLRCSMLLHISANVTITLFMYLIVRKIIWINIIMLFLSMVTLIFLYIAVIRKDLNKYKNDVRDY